MKHLFHLLLTEFSRIVLELSHAPVSFDQLCLFEEFAEINLVFNGFRVLHQYQGYLWELFMEFRVFLDSHPHTLLELQRMLATVRGCKLLYYRMEIATGKVWHHYHTYLPYDPAVTDFQKQLILCKLSRYFAVQKHFLQLLHVAIQSKIDSLNGNPPLPVPIAGTVPDLSACRTLVQWKGKKVDLVELIMGLYYSQTVVGRHTKLSIQEFQAAVCNFFGVELSDFSVIASNIYRRKKQYAVFFGKMQGYFAALVANQ